MEDRLRDAPILRDTSSRSSTPASPTTDHRPPSTIRYEQAVYGSFPFWDRGYAMLAHSPGCRPEWLADFRRACQGYGEPPRGLTASGVLFSLRLPSGPWAIVGVRPQGEDDRGRPGALAFHGLFVSGREFRKVGFDPFALAGALRGDWSPETTLAAGSWSGGPAATTGAGDVGNLAARIASAMARGRRVAVASAEPIDGLARRVWAGLPNRVRRRASVATLASHNAHRFDLLALPRPGAAELDGSYLDAASLGEPPATAPVARRWVRWGTIGAAVALLPAAALVVARPRGYATRPPSASRPTRSPSPPPEPAPAARPPDASAFDGPLAPEDRRLALDGLGDLADRFGIEGRSDDPAPRMIALADRWRYRGPWLSVAERSELAADPGPDAAKALAWDRLVRHFAADRPLPEGFASGSLRWQLAALAWSFHVEIEPGRSAAEVPYDLADALALDAPVRLSPLADRHPALADYARFLAGLPRR